MAGQIIPAYENLSRIWSMMRRNSPAILRRLLHRPLGRLLAIAALLTFLYVFWNYLIWSPDHVAEHVIRGSVESLSQWESRLRHLESELAKKERSLKRRFPDAGDDVNDDISLRWIYVITPTYKRPVQKAELTRLAQTLMHVPRLHWVVVEDSENRTKLVSNLLRRSGLTFTHLHKSTPTHYKIRPSDKRYLPAKYRAPEADISWLKPRGVEQRNMALDWLRDNLALGRDSGVVYFGDDDNTYDIRLFDEMRNTKTVSVWPVGLVGGLMVERPLVSDSDPPKVTGWLTNWKKERPFALDMAGFAVSLDLLLANPDAQFHLRAARGYQETVLLSSIVTMDELEPKAGLCQMVYVWHTRTQDAKLVDEERIKRAGATKERRRRMEQQKKLRRRRIEAELKAIQERKRRNRRAADR